MLPPNNMPLGQLAKEEGISQATLAKWRAEARAKGQFLPDANAGPEGWTSRDKLSAVIETSSMNAADLGEYCRRRPAPCGPNAGQARHATGNPSARSG
jgi:hypothetical protein